MSLRGAGDISILPINKLTNKQILPMKKRQDDQIDELQKQIDEWKGKCLRALADYQNLEKRVAQEKQEIRNTAEEILIKRLLPVVDALKKAKDYFNDEGINLIHKELHAALEASGFKRIPAIQLNEELFNPHTMECVEVVEGKDNVVVEETLPGYKLRDRILRPTRVKVGKQNGIGTQGVPA